MTLETTPEAVAWALMEQIISSRKPLPVSVWEIPTTYFLAPPLELLEPPQAATSTPAARINPMALGHLPADIRQPPLKFKPSAGTARWVESDSLGKSCAATLGGNRLPPNARDRKGRATRCQTSPVLRKLLSAAARGSDLCLQPFLKSVPCSIRTAADAGRTTLLTDKLEVMRKVPARPQESQIGFQGGSLILPGVEVSSSASPVGATGSALHPPARPYPRLKPSALRAAV